LIGGALFVFGLYLSELKTAKEITKFRESL